MYSPHGKLDTPSEFGFPYSPPYSIQQQLMEAVYEVVEGKQIGIFESPTGTGKSLTLTCAALRWLEDHEELVRSELRQRILEVEQEIQRVTARADIADDWISVQFDARQKREELQELQGLNNLLLEKEQRLREMCERQAKLKENRLKSVRSFSRKRDAAQSVDSDEEVHLGEVDETNQDNDATASNTGEPNSYRDVQIFFCSRTHSQLTQVLREVKRTSYGRRIRSISLASRQQLCINPQVKGLPSVSVINERCIDMARSSSKCSSNNATARGARTVSKSCPFRTPLALQELSEAALVKVLDIEDLVAEGESSHACPYYAARAALQSAQLVLLPYQMLLHSRTRMQSGIDLRGAVIIIDEAHNLLDTISQIHSCELSLQQLLLVQQQISAYKTAYVKRFSATNLLRINQLLFVVKRLTKLLQPKVPAATSRILRSYEMTTEGEFFNIDLFQLLHFCDQTRFAQKLHGFSQRQAREPRPSENEPPATTLTATTKLLQRMQNEHEEHQMARGRKKLSKEQSSEIEMEKTSKTELRQQVSSSPMRALLSFLEALTESAEDGRVLLSLDPAGETNRCVLKYMLLNPSEHFSDVVRDARSIIVAGGTMQPTAELTEQLFRSCIPRVQQHFYDHVVPADAVLPFAITRGPKGATLCFNYAQRGSQEMLEELGMFLQNICSVVPAGVICFVPSYEYLDLVYTHLQGTGVLERISTKKRVFREPRSAATMQSVEKLLAEYTTTIAAGQGALLLSVVGAKLSEGLNFADDLGRGVVVVGLPYPNRQSPELQERMKYLDSNLAAGTGNEYYENLCMKAVNQCIGRSVRHIRDYACVYLLDERYSSERIQKKLPQWISRHLQSAATFGLMQAATARFFKHRLKQD